VILKTIELYGFKSFANKTKLDFDQGITAIVGPNGSGKSNIADAVRWVLGEQSAKTLRGLRMEDVIFAGSDSKRPLGIAEVSITFDNTSGFFPIDYSEITVTRRVFRSGESEYYLNKTGCRLKDIRELFMDTGIGKEGYSIIGQGKIDEILNMKAEDRRYIFEEAAGIAKFKSRKEVAKRRIEETRQNIIRIDDIISELEYQLIPLKEQADKAILYKDLSGRLKTLEASFHINKLDKIYSRINNTKNEIDKTHKIYNSKKVNIEQLETKITYKTKKLKTLEKETYEIKDKIHNLSIELEKSQAQITRTVDKLNNIKEKEALNNEDKKETMNLIKKLEIKRKSEIERYENVIKAVNEKELLLKTKANQLEELDELLSGEEQLVEKRKKEILNIFQHISDKKNRLSSNKTAQEGLNMRYSKNKKQLKELERKKEQIGHMIRNNRIRIKEIMDTINKSNKENEINLCKLKSLEMKISKTNREMDQLNERKLCKRSNINLLNEMEKNFVGFNKSVQNVLKTIPKAPNLSEGFCGVVAKLIETDKKHELAIEATLGSALQFFVTEKHTDAAKIINYLKKHKLGRATFLPLDTIRPNEIKYKGKDLKSQSGFIAFAKDVVKYDMKYANIVKYLLSRVIIVKDINSALNIANHINYSYKIVTLDGDIISPRGSITGGSSVKRTRFLNRSREIATEERQLNEIVQKIKLLQEEKNNAENSLYETNKKIADYNRTYRELELELSLLQKENENLLNNKNEIEILIHNINIELKELTKEKRELDKEISSLNAEINLMEENSTTIQKGVSDYQDLFSKKKIERETVLKNITELKINLASITQEKLMLRKSIKDLESEIKQKKEVITNIDNKLENSLLLKEVFQKNLSKYKKENVELTGQKTEDSNLYEKLISETEKLKKEIESLNMDVKELNLQLNYEQEQSHKMEIRLTKQQMEAHTIENTLWHKFSVNYKEIMAHERRIKIDKGLKNEINNLKSKIKDLGEINLGAINEYQRIKERHNFLFEQKADLMDAQEDLNRTIAKIASQMEKQFIKCFEIVNNNFKEVFKELFGGGEATLILENRDNVLSSGIEIEAQPTGKKLQNISLLSGGEKALTAIALLFGILKYRPTPFCILDEIETSLDDVNLRRFTQYLLKLSKETQFVLITHRKETMETAETLYGVTMEESAVSKLVGVRLEDAS